jgi:hypothetical protein
MSNITMASAGELWNGLLTLGITYGSPEDGVNVGRELGPTGLGSALHAIAGIQYEGARRGRASEWEILSGIGSEGEGENGGMWTKSKVLVWRLGRRRTEGDRKTREWNVSWSMSDFCELEGQSPILILR